MSKQNDIPLNEAGIAQAETAAARLKNQNIAKLSIFDNPFILFHPIKLVFSAINVNYNIIFPYFVIS